MAAPEQTTCESPCDCHDAYGEDEDVLRDFIAEKIEPAKGHELAHKELYRAYKDWHAEGSSERPFSTKKMAQMFGDRGYKSFRGHSNAVFWWGVPLKGGQKWLPWLTKTAFCPKLFCTRTHGDFRANSENG